MSPFTYHVTNFNFVNQIALTETKDHFCFGDMLFSNVLASKVKFHHCFQNPL